MNANKNELTNSFLERLQTIHADGSKPIAPYIALTDQELRLYTDVGLFYAIVKCDQILEVYKKPPVKYDHVDLDEAMKLSGAGRRAKTTQVEYDRLMREAHMKEFHRKQAWHRYVVGKGREVWRGKFTSRHLLEPEKIEFVEMDSVHLQEGQVDALSEIAGYLNYLHQNLKGECFPEGHQNFWDEGHKSYKTILTLGMASKYLTDFVRYAGQQDDYSTLDVEDWFDPEGG